MGHRRFAGVRS